ncbi:MAG: hypothetical protein Q8L47_05180 [bacterium]|nr:hypothetical protein [bacterium]
MINPFHDKIHINFSTDRDSSGTIIRSSMLINIKERDVSSAVALFEDLQRQLEGRNDELPPRDNGENTDQNNNKEISTIPNCLIHDVKMLLRSRKSDGQLFFGCPMYQSDDCKKTAQYPALVDKFA